MSKKEKKSKKEEEDVVWWECYDGLLSYHVAVVVHFVVVVYFVVFVHVVVHIVAQGVVCNSGVVYGQTHAVAVLFLKSSFDGNNFPNDYRGGEKRWMRCGVCRIFHFFSFLSSSCRNCFCHCQCL